MNKKKAQNGDIARDNNAVNDITSPQNSGCAIINARLSAQGFEITRIIWSAAA